MIEPVVFAAFLAFCRVGACFMLMPGLSSVRVPVQVRLFVAVAASIALLAHMWDTILPFGGSPRGQMLPLIASELLVGALIGLMARLYVLALQFMANGIAMMTGFGGMPGVAIEEDDAQAALAAIISIGALLLLFIFDFHHAVIRALVASYRFAPLGVFYSPQTALDDLTASLSDAFLLVLRLGSPFIAYAILVNLGTGFVNKLTPQIPIYFISLPMVIAGGLLMMYLGIGTMLSLFADGFADAMLGR
jgi:flagellar biosynthetic protein FliR